MTSFSRLTVLFSNVLKQSNQPTNQPTKPVEQTDDDTKENYEKAKSHSNFFYHYL